MRTCGAACCLSTVLLATPMANQTIAEWSLWEGARHALLGAARVACLISRDGELCRRPGGLMGGVGG